ncbi:MAG: tryptophan-rich sensory protein [Frankiaceae bacterium]|nr:tryptophan-rich sensory protein [Frankiaceae bacterium]
MPSSQTTRALGLAGSLGGVTTAAGSGAFVIRHGEDWYRSLDRPRWAMPTFAMAPTWALVAASQAVGAWLLWRAEDNRDALDVPALSSYAVQVWLSLAWMLLFFGLRKPALAMIELGVLWLATALTLAEFGRRHPLSAILVVPSLAAVSYLAALNVVIWRRNR